jgi:penicillin-binding protein 1A
MWIYFMAEALKGVPEYRRPAPPGLVSMRISSETGLAARPGEPGAVFEYFMAGRLPAQPEGDAGATMGVDGANGNTGRDESLF